ncbi:hypothetical protein CKM354_000648700 [Cercospora kikuchii]|uniref:non-specific serine/threonine protein kinase n=1 Tax=Cercospora kikuchii TaxID=84275 RepID=A0A9P3CP61_9PEZI|nr:uncharacterized protein CKM354_000648700 [Cercospora kikuchii]GIZ43255.1 hypothetical protein CKM354_000648700 [Cercospora kikuchii]
MPRATDIVLLTKLEAHLTETAHTVHTKHINEDGETVWKRDARCLGRGGFGEVFREECIDGPLRGTLRAVKLIQRPNSSRSQRIDFSRELEAIARFSQPQYELRFVKSLGWYETYDTIFIAMEFLEYGDLEQYASCPLPEHEMHLIASQVLQGLTFMHSQGYAHRDLKPQNLLVHRPRPQWQIKIADFGLSKRVAENLSSLHTHVGTQGYMAPEVLGLLDNDDSEDSDSDDDSAPSYSNAVDIWALGVITFFMLTTQLPFSAMNLRPLKRYVRGKTVFPMEGLRKVNISDSGCTWIESCMAPFPHDRPSAGSSVHERWRPEPAHFDLADPDSLTSSAPNASIATASWRAIDSVYASEYRVSAASNTRKLAESSIPVVANPALPNANHVSQSLNTAATIERAIGEQETQTQVATSSMNSLPDSPADRELDAPAEPAQVLPNNVTPLGSVTLEQNRYAQATTSSDIATTDAPRASRLSLQADAAQDPSNLHTASESEKNRGGNKIMELADTNSVASSGHSVRTTVTLDPTMHSKNPVREADTCAWLEHMAVSVDNRVLGAICGESTMLRIKLRLWSTFTGKTLYEQDVSATIAVCANNEKVNHHSLAIGPKGSCVAMLTADCTIHIWNLNHSPSTHRTLTVPPNLSGDELWSGKWSSSCASNDSPHIEFSGNGKFLAYHANGSHVYDVATMSLKHEVRRADLRIAPHAYRTISPDGQFLAYIRCVVSERNVDQLHFWSIHTGRHENGILSHVTASRQVCCPGNNHPVYAEHPSDPVWLTRPLFSKDGRRMCVFGTAGIRIWDLSSGQFFLLSHSGVSKMIHNDHNDLSSRLAFSRAGRFLAALASEGGHRGTTPLESTLWVWDLEMSGCRRVELPTDLRCLRLVFRDDDVLLIIGYVRFTRASNVSVLRKWFHLPGIEVGIELLLLSPALDFGFLLRDGPIDLQRNLFTFRQESIDYVRQWIEGPTPVTQPKA